MLRVCWKGAHAAARVSFILERSFSDPQQGPTFLTRIVKLRIIIGSVVFV